MCTSLAAFILPSKPNLTDQLESSIPLSSVFYLLFVTPSNPAHWALNNIHYWVFSLSSWPCFCRYDLLTEIWITELFISLIFQFPYLLSHHCSGLATPQAGSATQHPLHWCSCMAENDKTMVSNLTPFAIWGIFSPTCPFLVLISIKIK